MMRACGWKVSETELKVGDDLMISLSLSSSLIQDLVSVIDQDGDGNVNFNEFVWFSEK